MPYGYSMFTPMTKTKFDVNYEFFENGIPVKTISLEQYLNSEFDKGLFHNKTASVKSRIYFEQIFQIDLAFQKNQYAAINNPENLNFSDVIKQDPNFTAIIENIQNFPKLYLSENPEFHVDSVSISVIRKPMILPFNPNYKGDYTYVLGNMIFYKSSINISKSTEK